MTTAVGDGRLEWMDDRECLRLLGSKTVGRLAVVRGDTPLVFPVNYSLVGRDIVFRTDPGAKLAAGGRAPATFEVDDTDTESRTGWSVVATGRLDEVTDLDGDVWQAVHDADVVPWARGPKAHWMRLSPERITGRRIVAP